MENKLIIGNIDWLRNDYRMEITVGGITYPTLEHAYQASKLKDRSLRLQIANTDSIRDARRIGKNYPERDNFDNRAIMGALLQIKFRDVELADRLARTGSVPIVMEGYNEFWGTGADGNGENVMGELIQDIRSELQFVMGIDLDEPDDDDDGPQPTLKQAILDAPDEELATLCQKLLDLANKVMTVAVDANDYNVEFLQKHTGLSREAIAPKIKAIQDFQETITKLESLLEEKERPDADDDADDEEGDDSDDPSQID
jgi:predicted NAD-dependent protein-ADP-ribosyltransferase YbiA (DUF1768 family)